VPWLLAACGSSGSTFALIGVPAQNSYTDSANFLISGDTCNYYTYRGDGTSPPEVGMGCKLLQDKTNALGAPHSYVEIAFNTPKGQQILALHQFGNNTLIASSVPDIGMYLPSNWTVSAPAADMVLDSTAASSVYSGLAVHISGVRCSMTITAVATIPRQHALRFDVLERQFDFHRRPGLVAVHGLCAGLGNAEFHPGRTQARQLEAGQAAVWIPGVSGNLHAGGREWRLTTTHTCGA